MRIPSPNPDFDAVSVPGQTLAYAHPATNQAAKPIPLAFQVTSPFNSRTVLFPHALVVHVNPSNLQESSNQKIERIQTRGGFVEQHWGHELVELQADQSTGAFMNIRTGLTSVLRRKTIAWDKFRDLHDLFRHNGSVYDPFGNIVLQGDIMLMYDKGIYLGTFRSFEWEDTEDTPFSFKFNWTFKVTQTILAIDPNFGGRELFLPQPTFQGQNLQSTTGGSINGPAPQETPVPPPPTNTPGGLADEANVNDPVRSGPRGGVGA